MITPPRSISARPRLTRAVPVVRAAGCRAVPSGMRRVYRRPRRDRPRSPRRVRPLLLLGLRRRVVVEVVVVGGGAPRHDVDRRVRSGSELHPGAARASAGSAPGCVDERRSARSRVHAFPRARGRAGRSRRPTRRRCRRAGPRAPAAYADELHDHVRRRDLHGAGSPAAMNGSFAALEPLPPARRGVPRVRDVVARARSRRGTTRSARRRTCVALGAGTRTAAAGGTGWPPRCQSSAVRP